MVVVLNEHGETVLEDARASSTELWLSGETAKKTTGWELKAEGLCREDVCVPVPTERTDEFIDGEEVNMAAFWRHMDRPAIATPDGDVWILGAGAAERARALESLQAPDFQLPDLAGHPHALSEHRGKKILLATWASW